MLSPCTGQVAHALLTRPPLMHRSSDRNLPFCTPVRLACVRHAASVHPEPGSNSHVCSFACCSFPLLALLFFLGPWVCFSMDCLFFEFPLNFPLRFLLPSCSPFTGLQAFRFFEALGIFRAALLFICQGSVLTPYQSMLPVRRYRLLI